MIKSVIKRDGNVVEFDINRIKDSISKAMARTEKGVDSDLIEKIAESISKSASEKASVDKIQDMVERKLMDSRRKDAAQTYIKYRQKRDVARQSKTRVMFEEIINAENNDITRENANMNSDTPAGMMMKFASETTKPFVDTYLLREDIRDAVDRNYIHVHDKDYYPTKSLTCLQHPLDIIFKRGFRAGHGELRPPKRIETAATQACVSMETVQNEMHGGQAIPAFDYYLAPFVRLAYQEEVDKISKLFTDIPNKEYWDKIKNVEIKDYVTKELPPSNTVPAAGSFVTYPSEARIIQMAINQTVDRVHQAMESFVHNMNNIHSRGGNQVVFSSINYGTDTSAEGRCIIREVLRATEAGVGNGATAIFPIQIWKLKAGVSVNPEDPNYDLFKYACKVSARRFFPNFLNLDSTFNRTDEWKESDPGRYKHEVAVMGCRTRLWLDRFGETTSIGRGNISFTTVNLPKLAIEAAIECGALVKNEEGKYIRAEIENEEEMFKLFMKKLEETANLAAEQLHERYKFQATAKAKQFPLLMAGLWKGSENLGPEDSVEPAIKHGTLSLGYIGLAEALVAMFGKHHGESEEMQKKGLEIVGLLNDLCKNVYSEKYDLNYTCLATPAEGLSGKFTKVDKKEFGEIKGVTDREYYTNSNHVPVYYNCSAKHKAEIEGPYHKLTPAGHIFYVEVDGGLTRNSDAIEDLVRLMIKNDVGYGSINHNQIRCESCGHESESDTTFLKNEDGDFICPKCGSKDVTYLARITGYLTTDVRKWNSGKKGEFKDRVVHAGQ